MNKIVLSTILAAATAATLSAASIGACAGCHGANFEKAALHGYKDGSYGGPMKGVMKGQVARLSDADITDIAKQIAAMK